MSMTLIPDVAERRRAVVELLDGVLDLINSSGLLTTEVMSYYSTFKVVLENPISDETPLPALKLETLIAMTRIEGSIHKMAQLWLKEKPPAELVSEGGWKEQT
jgi:hypothetical protein